MASFMRIMQNFGMKFDNVHNYSAIAFDPHDTSSALYAHSYS